mgnify:FL=1
MPTTHHTADEQRFWDQVYLIAFKELLRKDGRTSDTRRITLAGVRADGALDVRRRNAKGDRK